MNKYGKITGLSILVSTAILLISCSSKPPATPAPIVSNPVSASSSAPPEARYSVPSSCQDSDMLAALSVYVPESKFIYTAWTPVPGTELEAVLSNGGIACTFGIQRAEIGISAMWVKDPSQSFSGRTLGWIKEGYVQVNIPSLNENSAFFLHKAQTATQEFHIWKVNLLFNGFWVQLSSSFGDTIKDNLPLLRAAIESLSP